MRHLKTALITAGTAAVAVVATLTIGSAVTTDETEPVHLQAATPAEAPSSTDTTAPADGREEGGAAASTEGGEDRTDAFVAPAADGELLTSEEAGELAAAEVPGEVLRVVRDDDDGQPEYEVMVRGDDGDGYEIHVHGVDGRILESERDDLDDADRPVVEPTVERAEAEGIALDAAGATEVLRAELSEDDGRPEWEVEVRREDGVAVEVTLEAADGTVHEIDVD